MRIFKKPRLISEKQNHIPHNERRIYMKKLLSVILVLTLICGVLSITSVSAEYDSSDDLFTEEYNYEVLEDGTAAINKYLGSAEEVTVPSEIEGYKVTVIHRYAFAGHENLKKVTIPEGVVRIGYWAFEDCYNLEELILPDSLEEMSASYIDETKLYKDRSNWENGVLYIGNHLIDADTTPLTDTYTVKEGTVSIANSAFSNFKGLTEVVLPESIRIIGEHAFADCENLQKINLPDGITKIGFCAFDRCKNLSDADIPKSIKEIGPYAFRRTAISELNLPEGLEIIGYNAFSNCTNLTSVTVPQSVTELGEGAFSYCENLSEITLPQSLEVLGNDVLYKTPYYNDENNWENGLLYFEDMLISVKGDFSGGAVVKDGTTLIAQQAFSGKRDLISVIFPDSVKSLGDYCFSSCYSLRAVDLPDTITEIPAGAFNSCVSLESISIPEGVKSIGNEAFMDCKNLKYISIPTSVETFGTDSVGFYNPYFEIDGMPVIPEEFSKQTNLVIAGYKGSAAEEYANEHGFKFEDLNAPTLYEYKDKVLEILAEKKGIAPEKIHHYDEVYDYHSFYENLDESTPDFVLINLYSDMVLEADLTYNFGDYIMYERNTSTPARFSYVIYIPATNRLYSLVEAWETGVEGVETLFTNEILGEMMGDVNNDEKLNIRDATLIQKDLANRADIYSYFKDETYAEAVSDFNGDGKLSIRDATAIQKYLAGVDINNPDYEDFENSAYESTVKHTKVTVNGETYDLRSDEVMTLEVVLTSNEIMRNYSFDVKWSPYYNLDAQTSLTGADYIAAHCPNAPADAELRTSSGYICGCP